MNALIDTLTADERVDLLAGLKRIHLRETTSEAISVGALFESQLRTLNRHADAEQVRSIIRSLQGAAA